MAEAFLCADAILETLQNVTEGLVVNKKIIEANVNQELPFNSTENILMVMVTKYGGNRQECHEKLRVLSQETGLAMKNDGTPNNLLEKIKTDKYFEPILADLDDLVNAKRCVGRAPEQVDEFLEAVVQPILQKYQGQLDVKVELNV